jgi:hypothetical protein
MEIEAQTSSVALSTNDLASQITELAGHLNAANHRWLMLIAEVDRRNEELAKDPSNPRPSTRGDLDVMGLSPSPKAKTINRQFGLR